MSQVFTLRMLSGGDDGFVRDFKVAGTQPLLELHHTIQENLGFDPGLMASFFTTDETWGKGDEVPLLNMTGEEGARTMENTRVKDLVKEEGDKLLYVYDYLSNRGFFMEVVEVKEAVEGVTYPFCSREEGDPPPQLLLEDPAAGLDDDLFGDDDDDDDLLSDGFESVDDLEI